MMTESILTEMQACKQTCIECQTICIDTLKYCKSQGGKYSDMTMMSMMRDCAEMCMICVNMINDGSEFMGNTCSLCAEICDRTAIACENMGSDATMMFCAAICRRCAEYCKTMGLNSASYFRRSSLVTEDTLLSS
ncbi:four-helix bundle copper-binding protein [Komarekiella sp. 'clone 1']|uniref:Four-helix bundle copper-binding protein n=1 Tax=Komarekiella delphini-convector SJRDD-AB1 TaxID=2593771 RepID=A0AA40STB0_9NOST|nr:four-helix bundle copper-binding protein [Komarekiella delphini-convector]MBD6614841.1 four-helix bundle copper-binding protein [Komarekiella delphini-convector SJRDD-AB1]